MGIVKKGVLIAAFLAASVGVAVGIMHYTSGSSQPTNSPTSMFHGYSTATGNSLTPVDVQPAAGECPVEVVTLKGKFTFFGKFKPFSRTIDNIDASNVGTATLYGFTTTDPTVEAKINAAASNPNLRLKVTITNDVPSGATGMSCSASTIEPLGKIASASVVSAPRT